MAHVLHDRVIAAPNARWSDFWVRTVSAVVLGVFALAALWFGGVPWALFCNTAAVGLGYEWGKLTGLGPRSSLPVWLALSWLSACLFGMAPGFAALAVFSLVGCRRWGWLPAVGLPYAGIGALSMLWLRLRLHDGFYDTLFLLLVVCGTDIGAYAVGRLVGGRKLAPTISPGKTVSGAIGGLAAAALTGALMAGPLHTSAPVAVTAALALSICAQAGDLMESAIKRKLGVKDSGNTIPGHGGLFDRLDGFLVAAPLAALIALLAQTGVPLWR